MTRIFLPLLLAMTAAGANASLAGSECLSDWGKAAEVVRQEGLMTVEALAQARAGDIPGQIAIPGQIVRATLCKEKDGYVYKLVVRDGSGQMKNVVVDALNHTKPAKSR